ncbi:His Kinase A (phospho-acceptor) domain-containing protein [Ruminococcus flavefaciens]|uniref:histidine kinase n=1 Tax=Ruminococcus flavefaciens TaxID=1265 RepID=A0A1H6JXL9_RUMFL|nr:HAMP domain-containing sensor histidine kinase [Ruminococcus flavefaciens]SEH65738.1 His Kinase A (phospho-acceptor) domain-containing protein [Ruminococcus flavefaciens]
MLKRLRIKFIAVIMSIVTVLFIVIFGLVLHFTKQNIARESIQMMRTQAFRPPATEPMHKPDNMPDNIRLPFFTVHIAKDGELTAFGGGYYDLTDKELLQKLVDAAEESSKNTGILPDYDLRYIKNENGPMKAIVFADISSEKAMIRGLIRNSVIIGLIGYVVFFIISLLLAKWVTKPVEKTWNEQKQFIADASHELKTPLTVIMTNAEMMTDKTYAESDMDNFTKNILSTSKRMRGLIESLLELARLDNNSNRAPQKFTTVDCSKLINDSILPFEPLFYENEMELSTDIDENIKVEGDKEKLRQVINILLDNALKYSDPADKVTVKLKRQSANCLLSVTGLGTSLTKEDCENIFKRFYRVDQSRNDGQSYGLGLSIAESIVSEHNGKIWAESENCYNTFYVSLPV